jgi:NAD(P)-dependent dehydrogenase (short-subunit alcohol dehydrogenase family)
LSDRGPSGEGGALAGKVVVVTGAGRGIGRALARDLSARGAEVVLCARTRSALDAVAEEVRDSSGRTPLSALLDVRDAEGARQAIGAAVQRWGRVDGLVNNAAILGPVGPVDQLDPEEFTATLETNVVGAVNLTAAFVGAIPKTGGSVVNLSGGGIGGPGVPTRAAAYVASKAAVGVLTESLARELAPRHVRVNAVAPGALATGFLDGVVSAGAERAGDSLYALATDPCRPAEPSDGFFEIVSYLLSDRSSWLSGRILSARWDSIERVEMERDRIPASSMFTLRRIDETLFSERDESGERPSDDGGRAR